MEPCRLHEIERALAHDLDPNGLHVPHLPKRLDAWIAQFAAVFDPRLALCAVFFQ
jgi:hypothetical protein